MRNTINDFELIAEAVWSNKATKQAFIDGFSRIYEKSKVIRPEATHPTSAEEAEELRFASEQIIEIFKEGLQEMEDRGILAKGKLKEFFGEMDLIQDKWDDWEGLETYYYKPPGEQRHTYFRYNDVQMYISNIYLKSLGLSVIRSHHQDVYALDKKFGRFHREGIEILADFISEDINYIPKITKNLRYIPESTTTSGIAGMISNTNVSNARYGYDTDSEMCDMGEPLGRRPKNKHGVTPVLPGTSRNTRTGARRSNYGDGFDNMGDPLKRRTKNKYGVTPTISGTAKESRIHNLAVQLCETNYNPNLFFRRLNGVVTEAVDNNIHLNEIISERGFFSRLFGGKKAAEPAAEPAKTRSKPTVKQAYQQAVEAAKKFENSLLEIGFSKASVEKFMAGVNKVFEKFQSAGMRKNPGAGKDSEYEDAKFKIRNLSGGSKPIPEKFMAKLEGPLKNMAINRDWGIKAADTIEALAKAGYDVERVKTLWLGQHKRLAANRKEFGTESRFDGRCPINESSRGVRRVGKYGQTYAPGNGLFSEADWEAMSKEEKWKAQHTVPSSFDPKATVERWENHEDIKSMLEMYERRNWGCDDRIPWLSGTSKVWQEVEPYVRKNPVLAYLCAFNESRRIGSDARWRQAEPYIMKDPDMAGQYAHWVMERRWPEAEPYIKRDPAAWKEYCEEFNCNDLSESKKSVYTKALKENVSLLSSYVKSNMPVDSLKRANYRIIIGGRGRTSSKNVGSNLTEALIDLEEILQSKRPSSVVLEATSSSGRRRAVNFRKIGTLKSRGPISIEGKCVFRHANNAKKHANRLVREGAACKVVNHNWGYAVVLG